MDIEGSEHTWEDTRVLCVSADSEGGLASWLSFLLLIAMKPGQVPDTF